MTQYKVLHVESDQEMQQILNENASLWEPCQIVFTGFESEGGFPSYRIIFRSVNQK